MFRPTQSVDLKDPTPISVVLADGTAATVRQAVGGHLVIAKGRFEIASASIVNGQAVNLRVHGDYTGLGLGDLIRRSVKRSYISAMSEVVEFPEGKVCAGCGESKPLKAFFVTPLEPSGHTRRCRSCVLADSARFRRERAERESREAERRRPTFNPI